MKEDSLPEIGWFQRCIICGTITSNTLNYLSINKKYKDFIIETWCCYPCAKEKATKNKKFTEIVEESILNENINIPTNQNRLTLSRCNLNGLPPLYNQWVED